MPETASVDDTRVTVPGTQADRYPAKKLGNLIKRIRGDRRLTQDQLGAKIGVTGGYIGMLESGKAWPPVPRLYSIMAALGVDPNPYVAMIPEASRTNKIITSRPGKHREHTKPSQEMIIPAEDKERVMRQEMEDDAGFRLPSTLGGKIDLITAVLSDTNDRQRSIILQTVMDYFDQVSKEAK